MQRWHPAAYFAACKVFAERIAAEPPGVLHALFSSEVADAKGA